MRFDTPVYFQRITSAYDASTGDTGVSLLSEDKRYADVTDTATKSLTLIYGHIKEGSLTLRLQCPYDLPFDRIRIGEKFFRVDRERKLRFKQTLVVSEVQGDGED